MSVRSDSWTQLGGSATGGAFRLVNTVRPNTVKWEVTLQGPTGLSSPVIGPDRTIYIGTLNGRLSAVAPDPFIRWNVDIAGPLYAIETPAVGNDGTIYCLCRSLAVVRDHRTPRMVGFPNFVVAVNPDGAVRWRRPLPALPDLNGTVNCEIFSAPRVVSGPRGIARIIFVVRYTLMVDYPELGRGAQGPSFLRVLVIMDEQGRVHLFKRYEQEKLFVDAHGGGGLPGGATLGEPPLAGLPADARPYLDTPVVFGSFPARETWTIVAPGKNALYSFRWSEQQGALAGGPKAFPLPHPSAPAAFANGLLTGASIISAKLIDAQTLTLHVPDLTFLGGPTTVAGGLRQMYFVTRYGALLGVDSNGKVWRSRALHYGSVALPALSANHVHVATAGGLHSYSLDLEEEVAFVRLSRTSAGFSSPAIGPDGEVYVAAGSYRPASNSSLYAFFDANAPRSAEQDWDAPPRPVRSGTTASRGARKPRKAP